MKYDAPKHDLVTHIALVNLVLIGKNLRVNLRTASCCTTDSTKYHNIILHPNPGKLSERNNIHIKQNWLTYSITPISIALNRLKVEIN